MSDVVVILEKLKEEGFSLWLDGEKLRYKAPKESITKWQILEYKTKCIMKNKMICGILL